MTITQVKKTSSTNALMFLFPVVVLILGLFLFIFIVPQSYSQITDKLNSYKEQKTNYENLQKKLAVLQSTSPALLDQTSQAVLVMPDRNSVLSFISQMKNIAIEKNMTITDVKSGTISDTEEGTKKFEFEIQLEGDTFETITALLQELSSRAPLVSLDEATITNSETTKIAKLKISGYWAPLPHELPALTDPLPPFSPTELKTLERMSAYTLPEFTNLSPGNTAPRENPFN
jgi:Tfp pilus assembly protein PilO